MTDPHSGIDSVRRQLVDAARLVWLKRLIDHSRANSLLFYRDLKVSTLDLTQYEQPLRQLLRGRTLTLEQLIPAESLPLDVPDRSSALEKARSAARHALVGIRRKAVANFEEKGLHTLFLASGLATWPAPDGGRPYNAPVLLLPARIDARGPTGDGLRLTVDGEPQINQVLLYVLEEHFDTRIDAAQLLRTNQDEEGGWHLDPAQIFERLKQCAQSIRGFRIETRSILGNFSFAKMAMVEDLRCNADALAESNIVAAVAGDQTSKRDLSRAVLELEARDLDDRRPDADFLVLDADSTQHRAIVLATAGQNCVIQGPPGTGKSQTIANLIAQNIAEGRRVLFVAEKRAALEAVMKRLSQRSVGLGHITLDLHGAAVSRKEVMRQIGVTLHEIRNSVPVESVDTVHREFEERRHALNEHAKRVNTPRKPTGLSIVTMLGRLLTIRAAARTQVRLRDGTLNALMPEEASLVRRFILEASAHPTLFLGTDTSPWTDADIRDGRTAQWALDVARAIARELWPTFESRLGAVLNEASLRPPESLSDAESLVDLMKRIAAVRAVYRPDVFAEAGQLAAQLGAAEKGAAQAAWAFVTSPQYRAARSRLRSLRSSPASAATLLSEARDAARVQTEWSARSSSTGVPAVPVSHDAFEASLQALKAQLDPLDKILKAASIYALSLIHAGDRFKLLADDGRTPFLLPRIHQLRDVLHSAGLQSLVESLRADSLEPKLWVDRFDYVWLHSTLDSALASDPALVSFTRRAHDHTLREFIKMDEERLTLAAARVKRLHGEIAVRAMNEHPEQRDLIRREAAKRSRHIPLRQLLANAPDVLTRVAPCWLASPLSVSQLLDSSDRHFDLVIFDEASQVLQEEAIPSLYRARQVVVAGDRHQLPPTTFFATMISDGEDLSISEEEKSATSTAVAAIGGFESLLDTLGAFLPNPMLEWHYRSADERLIAFSNQHVYDGRLVTFPAASGVEAIQHILVPHDASAGNQEESASREVEEVVRQIIARAENFPHETLGVIAMGIKHARRVEAALDRAIEGRDDLRDFFALEKEERFFVKNLETVQGDERDAIILTIGYGKNADGTLPHRFGPLTQDVGYRRLNVAVTRARKRMTVISSFTAHDVDLKRSGSRGVQLLKAYLEYAECGGNRVPPGETAGEVPLNPFEADIRDELQARGIGTRPQFGASRYRIDLVAMHPQKHGRPVLAIECDGASYHSNATARDRDRLRQVHLQHLGWTFHRIWSTDWFFEREVEIERLLTAFNEAVRKADEADAQRAPQEEPPAEPASPPRRGRGPPPPLPRRSSIEEYSTSELVEYARWISADGLLRTDDELMQELFKALPFNRMGSRIRKRLEFVLSRL